MPDFVAERDLLNSQLALFNQIVRSKGQAFLDGINQEIERGRILGQTLEDSTQAVIDRTMRRESGALSAFRDDMVREFRKLIGQATIATFQTRLESLAAEAAIQTGGDIIPTDSASGVWVWVAVGSSATCQWSPKSGKYIFRGRNMIPTDFCANRHGMTGDPAFWDDFGRPRQGFTPCNSACECSLVPAEFAKSNPGLLEAVDLTGA